MMRKLFFSTFFSFIGCASALAQIAHGGYGAPTPGFYTGSVAGPGSWPSYYSTTQCSGGPCSYAMSRTPAWARDAIVASPASLKVVFPNTSGGVGNAAESGSGAAQSITASIEYPSGTCTPITFGGSITGSIPNNSTTTSDAIPVAIPNGAQFWVRQYANNPNGVVYDGDPGNFDAYDGEALIWGVSGVFDQTMTTPGQTATGACPTITSTASFARKPLAIVGSTQKPTVCMMGDSRLQGGNQSQRGFNNGLYLMPYIAEVEPLVAPYYGTINLGADGDRSSGVAVTLNALPSATGTAYNNRWSIISSGYCTHVIWEYGNNDWMQGFSAWTVVQSNFALARSKLPNVVWVTQTIGPTASSTDAYVTVANQTNSLTAATPNGTAENERQAWNAWVRAGISGVVSVDMAAITESSLNSGKWAAGAQLSPWTHMTSDGLHENNFGVQYILANSPYTRAMFCTDHYGNKRC